MLSEDVLLLVPPEIVRAIRQQGMIRIQGAPVTADIYFRLPQCPRCGELGHPRSRCPSPDTICPYCASPHNQLLCPVEYDASQWCCSPCIMAGMLGPERYHSFYDRANCPILSEEIIRRYRQLDLRTHVYRYLRNIWLEKRCPPHMNSPTTDDEDPAWNALGQLQQQD